MNFELPFRRIAALAAAIGDDPDTDTPFSDAPGVQARARTASIAFVRSDRPHALLLGTDIERAHGMPGVLAVLTAAESAGIGPLPAFLSYPDRNGHTFVPPPRPVFATDRVRHTGELVAAVVAATPEQARDAAAAIRLDLVDLPAIEGLKPGMQDLPSIHPTYAGNVAYSGRFGDPLACRAAEAGAAHVIELTLELPRPIPFPAGATACEAVWDEDMQAFDLRVSGPDPTSSAALADVFGLRPEQMRVDAAGPATYAGEDRTIRPEHVALLLAARICGRTVRWQEEPQAAQPGPDEQPGARITGRLALAADGRFLSLAVRSQADLGAWPTATGAQRHVHDPLRGLTGVYDIPAAAYEPILRFSNSAPSDPCFGSAGVHLALLIERLVDEAARVSGIDRVSLRRQNLFRKGMPPSVTALGIRYDAGDDAGLLREALEAGGWRSFPRRQREAARQDLVRGIGLCLFATAASAPDPERFVSGCHVAEVELDIRTGTVRVVKQVALDNADAGPTGNAARARGAAGVLGILFGAPVHAGDVPALAMPERIEPKSTRACGRADLEAAAAAGALGALANAVADALVQAGASLPAMPFTPQTLFRALRPDAEPRR